MEALALTSVTFATAISNLIPAITFILSFLFGMERLNLRKAAGKAKIIGTMTGISGAMLMTFYKGVEVKMLSFHINLFNQRNGGGSSHGGGGLFLVGAVSSFFFNASYALWLIIQAKMSSAYPYPYSSTALMCFMAALLSVIFTFCVERDLSQWKLGWNVRLLTVAYAGIVVSGVMVAVTSWCLRMKGPLFVSVFSPLMLVVVAFAGSTILDEKLYLGSIIGSLLIVCGLYLVLWGKNKEIMKNQLVPICHQ
ncbi:WAT1-related protein At1g68170-like [Arachis stenosperma]|uniref:WAT1-related protein At1g68170-like n=1 Tax=Arachis stenosperma TaxID=217475 RepID=UPI0025ABB073|nr:WAT1-related protein At1g68170-like [Arachis stenosperma]